jgi:hypothetical protein
MSFSKKFEFKSDLNPICPYCEREINIEDLVEGGTGIHQKVSTIKIALAKVAFMTTVFFCPYCRKILGVSKAR